MHKNLHPAFVLFKFTDTDGSFGLLSEKQLKYSEKEGETPYSVQNSARFLMSLTACGEAMKQTAFQVIIFVLRLVLT